MKEVGLNTQCKPRNLKPILGKLSLCLFPAVPGMAILGMWTVPADWHAEPFGPLFRGLILGILVSVFNVLFASVSIMMGERPRWPAITGLAVNSPPVLLGIILLYAALNNI